MKYIVRHYQVKYYCEDHVIEAGSEQEAERIAYDNMESNPRTSIGEPYDEENRMKVVYPVGEED